MDQHGDVHELEVTAYGWKLIYLIEVCTTLSSHAHRPIMVSGRGFLKGAIRNRIWTMRPRKRDERCGYTSSLHFFMRLRFTLHTAYQLRCEQANTGVNRWVGSIGGTGTSRRA
jgi:hypothetical protein